MFIMQSPPGPITVIDGRRCLYFGGSSYLGLHGRAEVTRAACAAVERFGLASATSRGGFGDTPPLVEVESRAAEFLGHEAAFYFPSGYLGANIFCQALADQVDLIALDQFAHYAIGDAAAGSGLPVVRFPHRNSAELCRRLEKSPGGRPLVMTDGIFAATGRMAPVAEYCEVLEKIGGGDLYLDDAHALGVLGPRGRGTFEHAGLDGWNCNSIAGEQTSAPRVRLFCSATLSKALGGYGGMIAGTAELIGQLKGSPIYAGTSPLPAPVAAATARAIELVQAEPMLRTQLAANVAHLRRGLRQLGLNIDESPVPIVSLSIGTAASMQQLQQSLMRDGIAIAYFKSYAGLGREGALRIAVFATHTPEMIDRLLEALAGRL